MNTFRSGYLDIHQISTGRGNAAYLIFPDGTTMLLDAGDLGVHSGTQEIMKAVPNDSKRPAEWIAQYIKHFSLPLKNNGALGVLRYLIPFNWYRLPYARVFQLFRQAYGFFLLVPL